MKIWDDRKLTRKNKKGMERLKKMTISQIQCNIYQSFSLSHPSLYNLHFADMSDVIQKRVIVSPRMSLSFPGPKRLWQSWDEGWTMSVFPWPRARWAMSSPMSESFPWLRAMNSDEQQADERWIVIDVFLSQMKRWAADRWPIKKWWVVFSQMNDGQ